VRNFCHSPSAPSKKYYTHTKNFFQLIRKSTIFHSRSYLRPRYARSKKLKRFFFIILGAIFQECLKKIQCVNNQTTTCDGEFIKQIKGKKKYFAVSIKPELLAVFSSFGVEDEQWNYNHSAPPKSVFFFQTLRKMIHFFRKCFFYDF
jgi:hypothetical protein